MSKTNLLLDTGIFVAFLVAMEPRFSGISIHEWLSVALAAVIVIHLLLHWKWIIAVGARFFKKLWQASRLKFLVDVLLFVDFIAIMMSGILISRVILPTLGLGFLRAENGWRLLHSLSADAGIWLVGLHFALNWDWVVNTCKRLLTAPFSRAPIPQPVSVTDDEPGH